MNINRNVVQCEYQTSCDLSYSCKPILLCYPVHQFGDPGVDPKGARDCASIPPRCDSHLKKVLYINLPKNPDLFFWNVYQTVATSSTSGNQRASAVTLNNKLLTRCTFDDFFRLIFSDLIIVFFCMFAFFSILPDKCPTLPPHWRHKSCSLWSDHPSTVAVYEQCLWLSVWC